MKHTQSFHSIKIALVLFACLGMAGCYGPRIRNIEGSRYLTIEGTVSDVTSHRDSSDPDFINFVVTIEEGNQRQRIAVVARRLKIEGQVVENSHVRVTGGFDKHRMFIATKIEDVETGAVIDLMEPPNWLSSFLGQKEL